MKVALVCVAKWEDYYLDEWLEYNHKLGFDKIIMYQNDWRTDIEKPYLEKGICDGRSVQVPLYNQVLKDNTEYDWIAFIDCDEFIVLKKHNNIKEFIEEYGSKHPVLALNWFMFGSWGIRNRKSNSLLKMFTNRNKQVNEHIKVIVNTRTNQRMMLPHNCHKESMDTNGKLFVGPFNPNGPTDVAYICHFHSKTKEDWELRCKRGRVDCDLQHDLNQWDKEVNNNIDIVDLSALSFLYGS